MSRVLTAVKGNQLQRSATSDHVFGDLVEHLEKNISFLPSSGFLQQNVYSGRHNFHQ